MELNELTGDSRWIQSALRSLELVKQAQVLASPNKALCGAIPGSEPLWGWYNDGMVLNWAAKFFIDALLKKEALEL